MLCENRIGLARHADAVEPAIRQHVAGSGAGIGELHALEAIGSEAGIALGRPGFKSGWPQRVGAEIGEVVEVEIDAEFRRVGAAVVEIE